MNLYKCIFDLFRTSKRIPNPRPECIPYSEVIGKGRLQEGKVKTNVKPFSNTPRPIIKPAPQKSLRIKLPEDKTGI